MSTDDPLTTDRTYLHIQPSDDPLHPEQVTRSITRLHRIDAGGFLDADTIPTYEILVVATGDSGDDGDRQLDWYVGVDTDTLDTVERTLRNCLPRSVDIETTDLAYGTSLDLPLDTDTPAPLADWDVAGLEWEGVGTRPDDWQCPLTALPEFDADERPGDWPLTTVLDGLATTDAPALVQFLLQPKPDWSETKRDRRLALEINEDLWRHGLAEAFIEGLFIDHDESEQTTTTSHRRQNQHRRTDRTSTAGRDTPRRIDDPSIPPSNARRMEALETVDARQSFTVNARAVAFGTDSHRPERTLRAIDGAFHRLNKDHYRIDATTHAFGAAASNDILERIITRTPHTDPSPLRHTIPFTQNASPAIVADRHAVGAFCCTDGPSLSPEATRALEPTPTDRQGLPLPPRSILDRYLDTPGLAVGHPLTVDRTPLDAMFALPPAVQNLHTGIYGTTGAGKTALAQNMQLHNHDATDGATIYLDQKGDGGPEDYARLHYARGDNLDDVYYFDCREFLPVLPLLSIEPLLDAGIDRERAVNMVTETYVATLNAASGWEAFGDAQAALQALKYLVKAQFDPVHGADTVSHHDVQRAAQRFRETGNPPPVSDGTLHTKLVGVANDNPDQFATIMGAVERRLAMATDDSRLAPLFTATADTVDADAFDLREQLDEDCVIVLDMGGYGEDARRMLAVAVIGQLWRALERRAETTSDPPLVNCYLEEAADIAATGILDTLLSQGRAFGVAITLAMQFPEQIRESHPRAYQELLNDVGTTITGSVGVDHGLAKRLATGDIDADAMAARLRALDRGEWLIRPAAPFADRKPRPFQLASPALPPGHPEGDEPLDQTHQVLFDAAFTRAKHRTRDAYGVDIGRGATEAPDPADADADPETAPTLAEATVTIPNANRFPDCLTYLDEPPFPLVCPECDARYAATPEGMRRAIECHHSLAAVDREDIPVCSLDLQLTSGELAASDYSAAQLRFLAAVYMAHQQRFDPAIEYDIVWDSMTDLQASVGVPSDAVDELVDDGLLTVDCNRPHKLYTVTPAGRDEIGVGHREGIAHGDGAGDLSESSLHVAMVEVGARLLEQEFIGPDQPGVECLRYPEVEGGRLDAAVVDDDGEFVATLEAERINNDRADAIPSDFDLMAACDPEAAWWIVKTRADGHAVLEALHDPADGEPRVETTYSESYAPQRYSIETPGLTAVHTFEYARDTLLDSAGPGGDS
ncbi:hypothetical protein [Halorarius litoreus]|uniref:hypothetical protein n=1 Tax=Halorarius litoreus TaxID=2962676 RepID=UPI0020CBF3EF|nr:hypothetical protein [Halorarius litoreus]